MEYPILEHDPTREAFIEPAAINAPRDMPERCVICFFGDVVEQVALERNARVLVDNRWEDGRHPVYEIQHQGERLAFFQPGVGAPLSAGLLEEVIAFGCRKFIACGGAGVLDREIALGHLMVVSGAVRDEGVSYHYLPPSRVVQADQRGQDALVSALKESELPYRIGLTWTTDAPYRETPKKIANRLAEGCLTVEMECAALMAVAHFRGVPFGQVLYGGDDLSGEVWDNRGWQSRKDVREQLFWLCADACMRL